MTLRISDYHQAYSNGASPSALIAAIRARLDRLGDQGIFLHFVDNSLLIKMVEDIGPFDPASKPLWGVPFAVKDNIDVFGMPTTAGCEAYAYKPGKDSTVVAQLKAAGAIPIGKTNLDQFATGLVGLRTPYTAPLNSIDPKLVPGGSSSGSAVAVAHGLVPFALGTDTAGSGRVPAGLNGIIGLKPSLGAISTQGLVPACRSLDCVSIFAGNIIDAQRVFRAASCFDKSDPFSKPLVQQEPWACIKGLKVGVPRREDLTFDSCSAAETAFDEAVTALTSVGMNVEEVPFGDFYAIAQLLYEGPWVSERYAAISAFIEKQPNSMHPITRSIIEKGRNFSAVDAFTAFYELAELRRKVEPFLESVDLLCVPTIPRNPSVKEVLDDPVGINSMLGTYTNFVNLLGMCGLTIPCGKRADGEPSSITFLASAGHDIRLSYVAEQVSGLLGRGDKEEAVMLAVVGAHLSGMDLNYQLHDLGAIFVSTAKTAPVYKLYNVPNSNPPKPGMIRVQEGGAAIEVEIWKLTNSAFGKFVANIPSPLGIGNVWLKDGSTIKCFLAEPAGLDGAEDITGFGGWRNYITTV
ncbi:MAG: allophanate hydrolase [Alphaproteobacteria bacterium]